jgi:hypothetical protein
MDGVLISNVEGMGNVVFGNMIGAQVDGTRPLGNGRNGVTIFHSSNTEVGLAGGSPGSGGGNVIAFNGYAGVQVLGASSGNSILSNAIFDNASLGIDLGNDGATPNDSQGHDGPNGFQNFPFLTSVVRSPGGITVLGALHSTPSSGFILQFFTDVGVTRSGVVEGRTFLGVAEVQTDASGNASFAVALAVNVAPVQFLTATATDFGTLDTSEFATHFLVVV